MTFYNKNKMYSSSPASLNVPWLNTGTYRNGQNDQQFYRHEIMIFRRKSANENLCNLLHQSLDKFYFNVSDGDLMLQSLRINAISAHAQFYDRVHVSSDYAYSDVVASRSFIMMTTRRLYCTCVGNNEAA